MTNPSSNESAFKAIYEACEEGIIVVRKSGIIRMANKAAHQIFGYDASELEGKTIENLIPVSLRDKHVDNRQNYMKQPEPRRMGAGRDLLAVRKSKEEFPVEISLNVAELNGEKHVIAYVIDISKRKKVERALKKSEEQLILYASQLEKRVKERTEELEKQIIVTQKAEKEAKTALERERELNELKSRFVSIASHEFRTPLSTILSSSSLIAKYNTQEGAQEKRLRHIDKIKSSISNLNGILNDFLSLSKLEEGKLDIDVCEVNLVDACKEVIEELSSIIKPGQQIKFQCKGHPQSIQADPKIIKNIVINLTSNAIKYSEKDIHVGLDFEREDEICICIIDHGMGIPEDDQKHLFERFFRAKNAINVQGTGLGLNIVKKYVEMLGGAIKFKSELDKGTEFHVTFPKN
ncbi:PAS domain-containing sensor histidine kinase [Fulvivirga sp. RKSG066]|uniref:PAS domain-containing sensor histidine kinase n=1 Tax=Fulvivirga aurantia TaxID=2529383 RepID=UPI0012BBF997|nr:PAS domain-containing sensor histidine kinase [Fulvivirga aurantia]MTI21770.1 PAS domain-containing sensor histidine kinase [Fulvivirga aurantia]